MAYNQPSDVRRALGLENQTLTDDEINEFLEEANRYVYAQVGKHQIDSFQGKTEKTLELFHKPLISIDKVYKNKALLVENTDYTTDLNEGKITLAEAPSEYDLIRVWYVPTIYKDLERAVACRLILQRGVIQTDGNIINTQLEVWKEYEEALLKRLNKKLFMVPVRDHFRNPYLW